MKKLFPLGVFVLLGASGVSAQTNSYHFDNFDTQQGVRIEMPATGNLTINKSHRNATSARALKFANAKLKPTLYSGASARSDKLSLGNKLPMAASKSLDGFTTGDRRVDSFIADAGARNGVDPVLLYAIMHRESSFKPGAVSPKGARGLMQLMPATAARFGVRNIFDPAQNIEGGARYVHFLLDYFDGDVSLALAGYNAGEGAVDRYGRRVPPYRETQEYVRRISERYALMRDPLTALTAQRVTTVQAAALTSQESSAVLYERNVYAVRLPDGQLRLVSQ